MKSRSKPSSQDRSRLNGAHETLDDLRSKQTTLESQLEEVKKTNEILLNLVKTKDEKLGELERRLRGVEESPTDRERRKAMKLFLGFRDNHLHIAIAGVSGVGKSSLLNALCGLANYAPGAPKACVIEGTNRISNSFTRYPAPEDQNIIYYEIPGTETKRISRYGYFKQQGLNLMNALILVWCDRVTDTDIDILSNCIKCEIPYFLIRTKCDRYIKEFREEVKEEYGYWENDSPDRRFVEAVYEKLSRFVNASSQSAIDGIKSAYESAGISPPSDEEAKEHILLLNKNSLLKNVQSGEEDENALDEKLLMSKVAQLLEEVDKNSS